MSAWRNAATPVEVDGFDAPDEPVPPLRMALFGRALTTADVLRALTTDTPRSVYLITPRSAEWLRLRVAAPHRALTLADVATAFGLSDMHAAPEVAK